MGLEGISRLAGGLLRCICRHDGMCEERGPFRKYPRRPASPCSADAVGHPLVRLFRGRFIRLAASHPLNNSAIPYHSKTACPIDILYKIKIKRGNSPTTAKSNHHTRDKNKAVGKRVR